MALPTTLSFGNFKILLGDGADPENFDWISSFTKKSFKGKLATGSTEVPDADDPDLPMWEELEGKTLSVEISGDGVLAMGDLAMWRSWWLSGEAKNIQIQFNAVEAAGGGYLAGAALLTDWTPGSEKGAKCSQSVTISGTGAFTWFPATA